MAFKFPQINYERLCHRLLADIQSRKKIVHIVFTNGVMSEHTLTLGKKSVTCQYRVLADSEVAYNSLLKAYCDLTQIVVNCTRQHDDKPAYQTPVTFEYDGITFSVVDGGVTGYESYYAEDLNWAQICDSGLYLCAGTKGLWDSLKLEAKEAQIVKGWLDVFSA